jgi:hypothetical protein
MKQSKKIFIGLGAFFLVLLIYASYDISQRTTFPGSKSKPGEEMKDGPLQNDTTKQDTLRTTMLNTTPLTAKMSKSKLFC